MVQMSKAAADRVQNVFDDLSQDFWILMDQTPDFQTKVEAAAGQFSGEISGYLGLFKSGWYETFDIAYKAAGLIAGNTNALQVDLSAIDRDLSHTWNITF